MFGLIVVSLAVADGLRIPPPGSVARDGWTGTRIVGVGWKKTGTTSLQKACQTIGMHPAPDPPSCEKVDCMDEYAAVQDNPTCCDHDMIARMKDYYQANQVKFVLTERKKEQWTQSVNRWMINKPHYKCWYGTMMKAPFGSSEFYANYVAHNEYIKQLFTDEPSRLLVLNLEDGDPIQNMHKLCDFVGANHSSCNHPFPQENHNLDRFIDDGRDDIMEHKFWARQSNPYTEVVCDPSFEVP